ncbi:MAG TPA: hypothetical protein VI837_10395 [Blastocatellia bacterium]|nr:hypothetical protein [Blastocatellia bacterium]
MVSALTVIASLETHNVPDEPRAIHTNPAQRAQRLIASAPSGC